jgi:hypothetical protein
MSPVERSFSRRVAPGGRHALDESDRLPDSGAQFVDRLFVVFVIGWGLARSQAAAALT